MKYYNTEMDNQLFLHCILVGVGYILVLILCWWKSFYSIKDHRMIVIFTTKTPKFKTIPCKSMVTRLTSADTIYHIGYTRGSGDISYRNRSQLFMNMSGLVTMYLVFVKSMPTWRIDIYLYDIELR